MVMKPPRPELLTQEWTEMPSLAVRRAAARLAPSWHLAGPCTHTARPPPTAGEKGQVRSSRAGNPAASRLRARQAVSDAAQSSHTLHALRHEPNPPASPTMYPAFCGPPLPSAN